MPTAASAVAPVVAAAAGSLPPAQVLPNQLAPPGAGDGEAGEGGSCRPAETRQPAAFGSLRSCPTFEQLADEAAQRKKEEKAARKAASGSIRSTKVKGFSLPPGRILKGGKVVSATSALGAAGITSGGDAVANSTTNPATSTTTDDTPDAALDATIAAAAGTNTAPGNDDEDEVVNTPPPGQAEPSSRTQTRRVGPPECAQDTASAGKTALETRGGEGSSPHFKACATCPYYPRKIRRK